MLPVFSRFKTPKHQQFKIVTRYYDPEKEARETRRKQIQDALDGKTEYTGTNISFKRPTRTKQSLLSGSALQVVIALTLIAIIFGWMEYGNQVFYYAMWLVLPIYVLFRLKNLKKRK